MRALAIALTLSAPPLAFACSVAKSTVTPGAGADGGGIAAEDASAVDAGDPSPAATCSAPLPAGILLPSVDLLGHPPYAADGCTLVYVASAASGAGELRARDLTTGAETVLAPASESPRRPTIAGDVIAWEAMDGATAIVRVRTAGATFTVSGPFDHAGEARAAADAVVFTGWRSADPVGDTDVFVVDAVTRAARLVLGGPGQQRFADISRGAIAATDFSEDPDGTFNDNETDLADVVLFDRATSQVTRRPRTGKQAFPMIASPTRLGYLDWATVHPEPKLAAYVLRVGDMAGPAEADVTLATVTDASGQYVLPSGRNGVIEWVQRPMGASPALFKAPADLSSPAAAVPGLDGLELFAPALAASFTLLGTRASGSTDVVLTAIAR